VLIAVGQFQRDIQNELTGEGVAAAEAEGRYRGRPPALAGRPAEEARSAYLEQGASIAALSRAHRVSRAAVRTALAGLLPGGRSAPGPGDQPGQPLPGRDANRCFCAGWSRQPTMPGASLCWPPPWPSRISGRGPGASAGVQSTPVTSPRVNSRSETPSAVVSAMKCMDVLPFVGACAGTPTATCGQVSLTSMEGGSAQPAGAVMGLTSSGRSVRPTLSDAAGRGQPVTGR